MYNRKLRKEIKNAKELTSMQKKVMIYICSRMGK